MNGYAYDLWKTTPPEPSPQELWEENTALRSILSEEELDTLCALANEVADGASPKHLAKFIRGVWDQTWKQRDDI